MIADLVQFVLDALAGFEGILVDAVTSPWMLFVLLAACVIDGFFPPVPSELLLVTAAAVMWTTQPQMILFVVIAATAGAWVGDNIAYALGTRIGLAPLPWMRRGKGAQLAAGVAVEFDRRPESILLTGRFIPVARVLINMAAGAAHLRYQRYLVLSLASAAAWACVTVIIAVSVGAFITPDPLWATLITAAIAMVGGIGVDRAITWSRKAALRRENA